MRQLFLEDSDVILTFDLLNWKLALHLLVVWGTFIQILIFLRFFASYEPVWDRQTDGKIHNAAYKKYRKMSRHFMWLKLL